MRSTFGGMEIAKRSLFAQQAALQTTAHNIANANTIGYTRQTVNLIASRPMEAVGYMRSNSAGQYGTGVEFNAINRIREQFLDHQFYNENKSLGDWTIRQQTLSKLEGIVNEPSDSSVRKVVEEFWNAWQVLSKEPENLTARTALKENALALTDTLDQTNRQLQSLLDDLTMSKNITASEVNSTVKQIANLNYEIVRIEGLGNQANDLRDQRDLLADKLSGLINIEVTETATGYDINMGNVGLISGRTMQLISGTSVIPDSPYTATTFDLEDVIDSGDMNSGALHGMIVSGEKYVTYYKDQLDSMVKALVEGDVNVKLPAGTVIPEGTTVNILLPDGSTNTIIYTGTIADRTLDADTNVVVKGINGVHMLGYTTDTPPQSGIPFFTTKDGSTNFTAGNITVNPAIVNKVGNIATSTRVYDDNGVVKVVSGNNDIALLVAGLRDGKFSFEDGPLGTPPLIVSGSFDEFLRALVGQLGVQANDANRQTNNRQVLVDQVDYRRQSVSGVSMDEEIANMIKYQHAYNAAARTMTTMDEMLDKVINGMGVVGR